MTYAFFPDLPALPDLPLNPSEETFHQYLTKTCDRNHVPVHNTVCTRHEINPTMVAWVQQNISREFHAIGLNCQGTAQGGVAIPHTDRTRNWTWMWILDAGGANVSTVFWQEQGHDRDREPGYYPQSYDNLEELETHVLPSNRWVLLNAKVIHSVENLQHTRKSIQVGFWDNTDFVKHWAR